MKKWFKSIFASLLQDAKAEIKKELLDSKEELIEKVSSKVADTLDDKIVEKFKFDDYQLKAIAVSVSERVIEYLDKEEENN